MLNASSEKAFDVVVTRDETRLGGDVNGTGLLIQDLLDAGVQLFYYFTDERVALDDALSTFLVSARNFAAELEREKISARTREHLMVKVRRGLNAGGRVFGFENIRVNGVTEYQINQREAAVVRRVFQLFSSGEGLKTIAKTLNDEHVPPARAGKRGTGSWAPSQIRSMLKNERYRGVIIWGRYKKGYRGGTKVRIRQADDEILRVEARHLQIIDENLWRAVQERFDESRAAGRGAAPGGRHPQHLLSGLARCSECGGAIRVESSRHGVQHVKVYACCANRTRGRAVCGNGLRRPIEEVNEAMSTWIQENVLREQVVVDAVREIRRRLLESADQNRPQLAQLEAEAEQLRGEIANLATAIATLRGSEALTVALGGREARLRVVEGQVTAAKGTPGAIDLECERMEREALDRLEGLRQRLGGAPVEARAVVAQLVAEPLVFTPEDTTDGRRYRITGEVDTGGLLSAPPAQNGGGADRAHQGDRACLNRDVPTGIRTAVNHGGARCRARSRPWAVVECWWPRKRARADASPRHAPHGPAREAAGDLECPRPLTVEINGAAASVGE